MQSKNKITNIEQWQRRRYIDRKDECRDIIYNNKVYLHGGKTTMLYLNLSGH